MKVRGEGEGDDEIRGDWLTLYTSGPVVSGELNKGGTMVKLNLRVLIGGSSMLG